MGFKMFLTKNNKIKWNWILIGLAITIVLCIAGILFFDKPLFLFLRDFNWYGWTIFDKIYDSEIWLMVSGLFALVIFVKKLIKSKSNNKKDTTKFSLKIFYSNFIEKSKDNYGFLIFCSVFLSGLIASFLKYSLGRQRPVFFEALGQSGFYPFTNEWAFNSMPSGHTTASFAGLVMMGLLFPKWKWATWSLAIIIGLSRVSYGAHWPSDIIFGAFIGMVSADLVKWFFYRK